jgi:hypothetical protein
MNMTALDKMWTLDDKAMIEETSALSGINKSVIKEAYEYVMINVIQKFALDPTKAVTIRIPLIGDLYLKHSDDEEQNDGSIKTNFNSFISLSKELKSSLAAIVDSSSGNVTTVVDDILDEKINLTTFSSIEE